MPNTQYDTDEELNKKLHPGQHDDLGMSAADRQSETDAPNKSFYRDDSDPVSNKDLAARESAAADGTNPTTSDNAESDRIGGLFRQEDGNEGGKKKGFKFLLAGKKRKAFAASVGGGVAGLGIFGFLAVGPLKVMHISENLQSTFSSSERAADNMTNRLLANYLIMKVIPGMTGSCSSNREINRSCAVVSDGDGPVSVLYRTWKDNNLEGKLYENHGLELRKEGNRYYMRSDRLQQDLFNEVRDPNNPQEFERRVFNQLSRNEVRQEFKRAMENETYYKRIMYRFKYGNLLERKYNIKRCVIACDYRDDKADRADLRKIKFKAWFVQRLMGPLNEGYALAFECAMSEFDCAKADTATVSEQGDKRTKFETDLQARVSSAVGDGRLTQEKLEQIIKNVDEINNGGLSRFIVSKAIGDTAAQLTGRTIPIVGWIDIVASIVAGIDAAGPAIKTMNYTLKSTAAVSTYMMYRTTADEIKSGEDLAAEDLGYAVESLESDFGTDQNGASAEASPYYNDIMGSDTTTTASLFPKAHAAGYKCNDGSTIATGLCPEVTMNAATNTAQAIAQVDSFLNAIPGLGQIAALWQSTIGKAFDLVELILGSAVSALTPQVAEDALAKLIGSIGDWFTTKLVINPFGNSPSGGRMFEMAALGANVANNDYAHYGLGAAKISDQEANNLRVAMLADEQYEFDQKSYFAKLFDKDDSRSVISRTAMAMPSLSKTPQSIISSIFNPFTSISITPKTNALKQNLDMGGVTQYGYLDSDEIFKTQDLEMYWQDNNCSDETKAQAWAESAQVSDRNGSFEHDRAYECKLIEGVALSNCGYMSDECLTPEELGETEAAAGNGGSMKISTFNIYYNTNDSDPGYSKGQWQERLQRSTNVIKKEDLDVVGLQEVREDQLRRFMDTDRLGDQYDSYPKPQGYDAAGYGAQNPIVWKTDTVEFVEGKMIPGYTVTAGLDPKGNTQVKLRLKESGQEFYVINHHDSVGKGDAIQKRFDSANRRAEYVKGLDLPVFVTGDFNSKYSANPGDNQPALGNNPQNLGYCILTSEDVGLWDAWDASKNRTQQCESKNKDNPNQVDHIYLSREVTVDKYDASNVPRSNGSDVHKTIIAHVTFPGTGGEAQVYPYTNPVWDKQFPDPSVIRAEDGTYHAYATGGTFQAPFQHLTSKNLVDWQVGGNVFKGAVPGWLSDERWAPDIAKVGDYYVFSFSGSPGGCNGKRRIGYATAKSAAGPFEYRGELVNDGSLGCGYDIDPKILETSEGIFLYYGSGPSISGRKMNMSADGRLSFDGARKTLISKSGDEKVLIEGAWVHKKDDYYYMFYSSGNFLTKTGSNEYKLHVARSKSPLGPFEKLGKPILEGSGKIRAPGHNSVTTDDAGVDWVVYHGYFNGANVRSMMIDKISYENGWPSIQGPTSTKQNEGPTIGTGGTSGGSGSVRMQDDYSNGGCERLRASGAPGLACNEQCVDFVKFRLKKNIDKNKFVSLGNGKDVANGLRDDGYEVNNTPAVNSVVSWGAGDFGMNSEYGHTAMVSAVNSDGSIIVEEYNYVAGKYSQRKIPAGEARQLTYAHTEKDFK